jgi:hypothetical protein
VHLVSLLGKREGINSSSAAYVKNYGRWWWEIPSENRLGPQALEFTSLAQ